MGLKHIHEYPIELFSKKIQKQILSFVYNTEPSMKELMTGHDNKEELEANLQYLIEENYIISRIKILITAKGLKFLAPDRFIQPMGSFNIKPEEITHE